MTALPRKRLTRFRSYSPLEGFPAHSTESRRVVTCCFWMRQPDRHTASHRSRREPARAPNDPGCCDMLVTPKRQRSRHPYLFHWRGHEEEAANWKPISILRARATRRPGAKIADSALASRSAEARPRRRRAGRVRQPLPGRWTRPGASRRASSRRGSAPGLARSAQGRTFGWKYQLTPECFVRSAPAAPQPPLTDKR